MFAATSILILHHYPCLLVYRNKRLRAAELSVPKVSNVVHYYLIMPEQSFVQSKFTSKFRKIESQTMDFCEVNFYV